MKHQVVIVGAGPCGMVLADRLSAAGISVRVLERQESFERSFRGEFLQPSGMAVLDELGVLDELEAKGAALRMAPPTIYLGERPVLRMPVAPGGARGAATVSQPRLLEMLDHRCRGRNHYRLDVKAAVAELVLEDGRVRGVRLKSCETVEAALVVVTSGRRTPLRGQAGLEVETFESDLEILWVRFENVAAEVRPEGLCNHIMAGGLSVLYPTPTGGAQLALCTRSATSLRIQDQSALAAELRRRLPSRYAALAEAAAEASYQRFKVACDRLVRWHAPGILFLGDAAHTFSAIGGVGVNMALRDAMVAAAELSADGLGDETLASIEARRLPETVALQRLQVKLTRLNFAPRLVQRCAFGMFPVLRRLGVVKPQLMQTGLAPRRRSQSARRHALIRCHEAARQEAVSTGRRSRNRG